MKLINKELVAKILNIQHKSIYAYVKKGVIPGHVEASKGAGGYTHLWDKSEIIASINNVRAFKRGESITKAQERYTRKIKLKTVKTDKLQIVFDQYLANHVQAIPLLNR